MNLYLKFNPDFDLFFSSKTTPDEYIKIDLNNGSVFLLNAIQASLMNNRKVIIANDECDLTQINIDKLNAHHFFRDKNFLFLNISLKNKIDKLKDKNVIYTKFQEIEEYLTELIKL